jgi:hypothetical protein
MVYEYGRILSCVCDMLDVFVMWEKTRKSWANYRTIEKWGEYPAYQQSNTWTYMLAWWSIQSTWPGRIIITNEHMGMHDVGEHPLKNRPLLQMRFFENNKQSNQNNTMASYVRYPLTRWQGRVMVSSKGEDEGAWNCEMEPRSKLNLLAVSCANSRGTLVQWRIRPHAMPRVVNRDGFHPMHAGTVVFAWND